MATNRWMDKWIIAHLCNGVHLAIKWRGTDARSDMGAYQKYYAEHNKPDLNERLTYDISQKAVQLPEGGGGQRRWALKRQERTLGGGECFILIDSLHLSNCMEPYLNKWINKHFGHSKNRRSALGRDSLSAKRVNGFCSVIFTNSYACNYPLHCGTHRNKGKLEDQPKV